MHPSITLNGINQAISGLNYRNKNALKSRLIRTIREYYIDDASIASLKEIDQEELIKLLWETGNNPKTLKSRRKNLSSLKSSINADLNKLYENGENSEGIIIGQGYLFSISDDAKNKLLEALAKNAGHGNLDQITDILNIVNDLLSNSDLIKDTDASDNSSKLDQLKELILGLSKKIGLGDQEILETEDVEVIDDDETEDVEVIDDDEAEDVEVIDDDEPEDVEVIENNDPEGDDIINARLLADEFDKSLASMDRFYNQTILIKKGTYIVGGGESGKNKRPEHSVQIKPFYIGKFPVTNALFEIFVEQSGYLTTAEKIGYGRVYYGRFRKTINEETGEEQFEWNSALVSKEVEGACWHQPFGPGSTLHNKRNHPVVQVSLEDVLAFGAWTGKRLPSENEWEAAARTDRGHLLPWGDAMIIENCLNIEDTGIGDTTPVDQFDQFANEFGVVDALGNVMEWTINNQDKSSSIQNSPALYVAKGGSWVSEKGINLSDGLKLDTEAHSNILGFRCVAH